MSVAAAAAAAASIPCIQSPTSSSSCSCSASSSVLRYSTKLPPYRPFTVRSSQTDGPLRRPSILRQPSPPPPPLIKPSSTTSTTPAAPPPISAPLPLPSSSPSATPLDPDKSGVITVEFQRLKAKELQEYFKQKKLDEADQGPVFGFQSKNELANGRWAMFGFAVGMLTEYATGSDFVDQVQILLSNFGIVDLY
ncbi:hypothetical protein Dimus_032420 [Dionaea muscipula]